MHDIGGSLNPSLLLQVYHCDLSSTLLFNMVANNEVEPQLNRSRATPADNTRNTEEGPNEIESKHVMKHFEVCVHFCRYSYHVQTNDVRVLA